MSQSMSPANTLTEAIERLSTPSRGFTFLGDQGEKYYSFVELRREVRRRAQALKQKGVRQGMRVALVLPPPEEFVLTFMALVYVGATPVPMYPPLSLGKLDTYLDTTAGIITSGRCEFLITTKQVESVLWPVVEMAACLRDLTTVEALFNDAPAVGEGAELEPAAATPDDVLFLQFTSGSTSRPKGVRVTHRSLAANGHSLLNAIHIDPDNDHGVSWLPLYHDMGLIGFVLAPLLREIAVTFIPTLRFIKRPLLWLEVLHEKGGTITFAPNFAYALLAKRVRQGEAARWNLSRVKVAGCGAEPIQAETLRRFADVFAESGFSSRAFLPCYGMAEATLAMTFKPFGSETRVDRIERRAYEEKKLAVFTREAESPEALEIVSCGVPFPGHKIEIRNDAGKVCGEREIGEICFFGPSLAAGYDGQAESAPTTSEAGAFAGGWLRTGDLGYLAEGELFVCGRKKDLIILNGRNYYPQALEWLVEGVEGVRRGNVAAFSVPVEGSEGLVIACEAKVGLGSPELGELKSRIQKKLAEQMSVSCHEVVILSAGTLPKTSSGKLQRQKTRTLYLDQTLGQTGVRTLGASGKKVELAQHLLRSLRTKVKHRVKQWVYRRSEGAAP